MEVKSQTLHIGSRRVGPGEAVYLVAEMSANHGQDFEQAVKILSAAKEAGADAVKLQTYTPDTLTINVDNDCFRVAGGTLWDGRTLHELYAEAYTPWEWQPKLKKIADKMELDLFSTPFDDTSVDFLESIGVPAYKIASFELVDLPLIRRIARTGKPVIMSTGMATLEEMEEAVRTFEEAGGTELALLKCTSAYPALPEDMNLCSIAHLGHVFNLPIGLSDHTLGIAVPITAVALGACIVEKHFTISRNLAGPDKAFSLEPHEFRQMANAIRTAEKAMGRVCYGASSEEAKSRLFRRSLFVVADVKAGETFTTDNIRSIRPGHGLHTRYLADILGCTAAKDIQRGTPLAWEMISGKNSSDLVKVRSQQQLNA